MKWKLCARVGADAMQSDGKVESDCGVKVCVCVWARETAKMVSVRVLAEKKISSESVLVTHSAAKTPAVWSPSFVCP